MTDNEFEQRERRGMTTMLDGPWLAGFPPNTGEVMRMADSTESGELRG